MFRPGPRASAQRPLRRAALLAAALIVLWIAARFLSTPPTATDPPTNPSSASAAITQRDSGRATTLIRPGYVVAILLLAGGGGLAVYLRRRNGNAIAPRDLLQPVGKLQLGPGQQVHLVSCGGEVLVIGTTASQVTLLKSFPSSMLHPTSSSVPRSYRHERVVGAPSDAGESTEIGFADILRRLGVAGHDAGAATLS